MEPVEAFPANQSGDSGHVCRGRQVSPPWSEWQLVKWETALPSRLTTKLPANTAEQVKTARKTYHRFGQFSDALARIRERIEREPMERRNLQRICWDLGIAGDFDIAEMNWRPDYDHFFYRQLCRR